MTIYPKFRLEHLPRIPVGSGETLAGTISRDDFEYFLGQLPSPTGPGPNRLPYELLRYAPETAKRVTFWTPPARYRPVSLQDCADL